MSLASAPASHRSKSHLEGFVESSDLDKVPVGIAHEAVVVDAKTLIGIRAVDAVPGGAQSVCPVIYMATLEEAMRPLGHSSPDAALRYQHAVDERDAEIADVVGQLIGRSSSGTGRDRARSAYAGRWQAATGCIGLSRSGHTGVWQSTESYNVAVSTTTWSSPWVCTVAERPSDPTLRVGACPLGGDAPELPCPMAPGDFGPWPANTAARQTCRRGSSDDGANLDRRQ